MTWRAPGPSAPRNAIEGLFLRNDELLDVGVFGAFGRSLTSDLSRFQRFPSGPTVFVKGRLKIGVSRPLPRRDSE
jgi:hypothetical protein